MQRKSEASVRKCHSISYFFLLPLSGKLHTQLKLTPLYSSHMSICVFVEHFLQQSRGYFWLPCAYLTSFVLSLKIFKVSPCEKLQCGRLRRLIWELRQNHKCHLTEFGIFYPIIQVCLSPHLAAIFHTKQKRKQMQRVVCLLCLFYFLSCLSSNLYMDFNEKFNANFFKYWYLVRKRFLESQGWYFACLESLDTIIPVLCYEGRNTQALCTNSCNSSAMPRSRRMPILVWFCENLEEFLKMFSKVNLT